MKGNSYSEAVKGARGVAKTPQAQPQACPDVAAASLVWEPSPASPSPPSPPARVPPPPPPSPSAFPHLNDAVAVSVGLLQTHEPLMSRSWATATKGTHSPSKSLFASRDNEANATEETEEMASPLCVTDQENSQASLKLPDHSGNTLFALPALLDSTSATSAPNAALWDKPDDADLIIRCRTRGGEAVHWKVHRDILYDMSEWMEKYMPPEAEDGSLVEWDLSNWDAGQLGAVLKYMYLEDFQGGVYDPNSPLNTEPLILNTVHFLAGTSCLCRPMMDQAIDQIDDTTELIQERLPLLRLANLDEFEISLRRALLIMYDEPDQWRIRALRIVMGKLMALCFPLILQNQRWAEYQKWWGMLRVRVVADHKWLYQCGMCQKSDVILSGFENIDVLWVKYRKEGWQPSDDHIFPAHDSEDPPDPPASAPPTPAGGKRKSKAIPIVDPSGKITSFPGHSVPLSTGKVKTDPVGAVSESAPLSPAIVDASPALVQSVPYFEDPFTADSTTRAIAVVSYPNSPLVYAGGRAHVSYQPHPVFPPPCSMRPPRRTATSLPVSPQGTQGGNRHSKVIPWLPDGPFYFAETSTGEPASKFAWSASSSAPPSVAGGCYAMSSCAPSVTGESSCSNASAAPSVFGESCASAPGSSIDPLDSPARRMAELNVALDRADNEPVDQHATPRASDGAMSIHREKKEDLSMDEATPRALVPDPTKTPWAVYEQANTPTAAATTPSNNGGNKKA